MFVLCRFSNKIVRNLRAPSSVTTMFFSVTTMPFFGHHLRAPFRAPPRCHLLAGGTLGIAVHPKGLRKYAASWRVVAVHPKRLRKSSASSWMGRRGFLSTLRDYGNRPPRGWGGAVHPRGLRKYSASWWVGRWGLLPTLKGYGNMPPRGGWDAGDCCPP